VFFIAPVADLEKAELLEDAKRMLQRDADAGFDPLQKI